MTRSGPRAHALKCALLISALLHACLVAVGSMLVQPRDMGNVGKLVLTALVAPDESPLEALQFTTDEPVDVPLADQAVVAPTQALTDGDVDRNRRAVPILADVSDPNSFELVPPPSVPLHQPRRPKGSGRPASFFGNVAYGDEFVYVLDVSGSMVGRKFERARDELLRSVDALRVDQSFYVVLFSDRIFTMFGDDALPESLSATVENKRRLRDWLTGVRPDGGTDPRDALQLALRVHASAVFLLSDGEFNLAGPQTKKKQRGRIRKGDRTVKETVERHASQRTPVHTIAFESPGASHAMKALAEQTGGEFRFISAPGTTDESERLKAQAIALQNEAQAMVLLKEARVTEAAHRWMKTLNTCQQIVDSYPGTVAARQAEEIQQRLGPPELP